MKGRKIFCLALVLTLALSGCGGKDAKVYVQSVASLVGMGGIAPGDRFGGLVVSENVAEIQKDSEKTVAELLVKEGDDVKEGQALFSYDTEELQLALEKKELERDQLSASIENYKRQIQDLEREQSRVWGTDKLQYTIQIQSTQVDLKEAELNLKSKEGEVSRAKDILEHSTVVSPVTGRVQSVKESGTDNNGNPLPYISIQQAGSYRIKGTLGELQRGGITKGTRMKIISRTDASQTWMGTVTLVDYENPSQGNNNNNGMMMVGGSDEMSNASRYPFYVELDSTDGLILGQHIYLEMADEEELSSGLAISQTFVVTSDDGSAYVWAENRGKLEKRSVTLGTVDDMMGTVEILDGLTLEDYIAFPDAELCHVGAATTHTQPVTEPEEGGDMAHDEGMMGMDPMDGGDMAHDGGMMDMDPMDGGATDNAPMDDSAMDMPSPDAGETGTEGEVG